MLSLLLVTSLLCNFAPTSAAAMCDADYGASQVCCGQQAIIASKAPGRKIEHACPEETPVCAGFAFGKQFGTCQAAAVGSQSQDAADAAGNPEQSQEAENKEATAEEAGGTAASGKNAKESNAQAKTKPKSEAQRKAEWCYRNYVSSKDCDKVVAARLADKDPEHLKKEDEQRDRKDKERDAERDREDAERDREDAERDREDAERDQKRDKEERSGDNGKGSDAGANGASTGQPPSAFLLAARGAGADAWQNDLSADERASLQHELSQLHKKSTKEQEIALQDGPGEAGWMRKEYIHKMSAAIDRFKKKAKAARDARAVSPPPAQQIMHNSTAPAKDKADPDARKVDSGVARSETLLLAAAGHSSDLGSFVPLMLPMAFSLLAYFAFAASCQRRSQQSVALLKDPAPV